MAGDEIRNLAPFCVSKVTERGIDTDNGDTISVVIDMGQRSLSEIEEIESWEYKGSGEHPQKFLATAMEALLGAYYLDHNKSIKEVEPVVRR